MINTESKGSKYRNVLFVWIFSSHEYSMTLLLNSSLFPGFSESAREKATTFPFPTCKWPNKAAKFVRALTKGFQLTFRSEEKRFGKRKSREKLSSSTGLLNGEYLLQYADVRNNETNDQISTILLQSALFGEENSLKKENRRKSYGNGFSCFTFTLKSHIVKQF